VVIKDERENKEKISLSFLNIYLITQFLVCPSRAALFWLTSSLTKDVVPFRNLFVLASPYPPTLPGQISSGENPEYVVVPPEVYLRGP